MKKYACMAFCIIYAVVLFAGAADSFAVKSDGGRELSGEILAEGAVLLQNKNDVLPLKSGDTAALFGNAQIDYLCGGGGSSVMFTDYTVTPADGLKRAAEQGRIKLYEPLLKAYEEHAGECKTLKALWGTDAFYENYVKESIEMDVGEELWESSAREAQVGIFFLARYASEGFDMKAEAGGYYLTDAEEEILRQMTTRFEKTVAILNIPSAVDISKFAGDSAVYDVDAVLSVWYPGEEAGNIIASLLLGDINPSGKLTVTFAKDYTDYYSSQNWNNDSVVLYEEDIFVGYRQFITFNPESILFGFGYGLSYTSFGLAGYDARENDGVITVDITVINTGERAGKEVIQAYFSAPAGVLGKPAAELAGYVKTPLLQPGESANLKIEFDVENMSSYDDTGRLQKSAYIMEKGDYNIYLGNSLSDAMSRSPVYVYRLAENRITAQLSERAPSTRLKKRLLADGTYEELERRSPEKNEQSVKGYENTAEAPEDKITLSDLYKDRSLMGAFLAQLSVEQMSWLAGGQGGNDIGAAAGSFVGDILDEYGGHDIYMTDGCHGVRVTSKATYFPSGICLASSYNDGLAERMGKEVGLECMQSGIDIWLGPGVNIIRNPLCGRNFEYYSEDPLLTGKIAAAVTKGVQSRNVAVSLKHYTANNKEQNRGPCDSQVSERALREIYLKGFEICIKEANPWTIMTTCGTVNGSGAAGNYDLMTAIPREEWGWDGVFLSDWANMDNETDELKAGHTLGMPRNTPDVLIKAYERGKITRPQLEDNTRRLVELILKLHTTLRTVDTEYKGTVYTLNEGENSLRMSSYASSDGYTAAGYNENGFLTECTAGSIFRYYVESDSEEIYDISFAVGAASVPGSSLTAFIDGQEIVTADIMNMTADDNFQLISSPVRVKLGKGIHEISVKVNGGTVSLSRIMLLKKSGAARSIFLRLSSALIAAFIILPVAVKKTVSAIFSHRRRKSNAMHAYGL